MRTADNAPPTWGLRLGAVVILLTAQLVSPPDVQSGAGWIGLAASLVLVVPAMRWRRSSRRFVTWTAAGWLCGGLLCVLLWPVLLLLGVGLPIGLVGGGAVALIGCGVGWGDHEGVHIRDA